MHIKVTHTKLDDVDHRSMRIETFMTKALQRFHGVIVKNTLPHFVYHLFGTVDCIALLLLLSLGSSNVSQLDRRLQPLCRHQQHQVCTIYLFEVIAKSQH